MYEKITILRHLFETPFTIAAKNIASLFHFFVRTSIDQSSSTGMASTYLYTKPNRSLYTQGLQQIISVATLVEYLDQMRLHYPYHQAVGFYLETVGYKGKELEHLAMRKKPFKFYIDYNIEHPLFNERWQVYFPKDTRPE